MEIDDPGAKPPSKILAFDSTKKSQEPVAVDLDAPFFKITRPEYPACNHHDRGVTLDTGRRVAICLCGVEIDCFDALLIYAHSQNRLVHTKERIEEHYRKEAEKKAKKPFVREVTAFSAIQNKRGRVVGYGLRLECNHSMSWDRRKPPRRVTCDVCFRNEKLKSAGVGVIKG